jgi:hypothetical protein
MKVVLERKKHLGRTKRSSSDRPCGPGAKVGCDAHKYALASPQLELVHRVGTEVPTGQGGMEKLVTGGGGGGKYNVDVGSSMPT